MSKRDLMCCICKAVKLGTVENSAIVKDDTLACGKCDVLWQRFRIGASVRKQAEVALAFDGLTMRGAVAAHLHAKIAETNPEEAARIEAMGDVMEAIRSAK